MSTMQTGLSCTPVFHDASRLLVFIPGRSRGRRRESPRACEAFDRQRCSPGLAGRELLGMGKVVRKKSRGRTAVVGRVCDSKTGNGCFASR